MSNRLFASCVLTHRALHHIGISPRPLPMCHREGHSLEGVTGDDTIRHTADFCFLFTCPIFCLWSGIQPEPLRLPGAAHDFPDLSAFSRSTTSISCTKISVNSYPPRTTQGGVQ